MLSCFSRVGVFAIPWTVARRAPLFMGLSRQEYWNGLLRPSLEDLCNPGTDPSSLTSPALAGGFFTTSTIWEKSAGLRGWRPGLLVCSYNPPAVCWRIPSCWGSYSFCSVQAFNWLDEAHPHHGEQSCAAQIHWFKC